MVSPRCRGGRHLPCLSRDGSRRRIRCLGETWVLGSQAGPFLPAPGAEGLGQVLKAQVPDGLGGRDGRTLKLWPSAAGRAAWPQASLQAKKTFYQVCHTESLSAEAKLREAERQEEKRSRPSATLDLQHSGPS